MKKIFIISAPSGTGKTTIILKLKERMKDICVPITYTTKNPRPEETDGKDYHFVSRDTFSQMIKSNKFLEWAEVYNNFYGTPKDEVLKGIQENKKIVLTIDTQGGLSIKKIFPETVLIGLLPPSLLEQEKRIRKRNGLNEKEIRQRMVSAREERKTLMTKYDFRLINVNIERTLKKIVNIITKGKK